YLRRRRDGGDRCGLRRGQPPALVVWRRVRQAGDRAGRMTRPNPVTDPEALREALLRRLSHRIVGSGELVFPAIPALIDHYLGILEHAADALGRPFGDGRESLRRLLLEKLQSAFWRSPASTIRVRYATTPPPKLGIDWTVSSVELTLEDQ